MTGRSNKRWLLDRGTKDADASLDEQAGSRRRFLTLGALGVAGMVVACGDDAPTDQLSNSGGSGTGGGGTGGLPGSGGASTGGAATGGSSTGGVATGGSSTGGVATGGSSTGGVATGGASTGGASTGGASTGGAATGGASTGGAGGAATGGVSATGGAGTGGTGGITTPVENTGADCTIGAVPSMNNPKLPDPLKLFSGTRISTKEEWTCLRAELVRALETGVYGPKMPKPDSLTATFSGGTLTIDMTVGNNQATLSVKVNGGGTESNPKGCVIACGGSSLPLSSYASISMSPNDIASESNLNGMVKNLYGSAAAKSGALIGWAWGCSRIIDGLELCPEAGIDLRKIMVTGCSRYGKGALAMGAFDERVALTLVQEGGSGGTALWRVSTKEYSMGQNIQECGEITGEAKWQGSDFAGYCGRNGASIATLPCDQHYAVAICAPRAILIIENDIDWLGPVATYGGGVAGRKVFEALGIADRCGVSIRGNHGHCQFPSNQQPDLDAFLTRFIDGGNADTNVDVFQASNTTLGSFVEADWIDWDVPTLSGNLPFDPFA